MVKNNSKKIVDLDRARRIKENVQKIKDIYKDDSDGLSRLANKIRKQDDFEEKNKTQDNMFSHVKCNPTTDTDFQNVHGPASLPEAPDDQNQE